MPSLTTLLVPLSLFLNIGAVNAAGCSADNCLRALRAPAKLAEAQSFCQTFTKDANPDVAGIPSFARSACAGDVVSKVVSACGCIAMSTSSATATATSNSVSVSTSAWSSVVETSTSSSVLSTSTSLVSSSSTSTSVSASVSSTSSAPTAPATGTPKVCMNPQLSCQNTTAVDDLCCFNAPGGQLLLTQFWDTAPSTGKFPLLKILLLEPPKMIMANPITGPNNSWTLHGLWPDKCDGTYEANCDPSREYTNVTAILASYGKKDLLSYMAIYWKDYQGNDEQFWEHEWGKHGTCISTLDTKCYEGHTGQEEVVDYFEIAVRLMKGLDSFQFLAAAGILPSSSATYTLNQIQSVLTAAHGFPVTLGCSGARFEEIWYHYNVLGSVPTGEFVPTSPDGTKSDCPATGIRYLPKHETATPTPTSSVPGSTPVPTGAPYVGKGFLNAVTGGAKKGCLISAGTWYTSGTCATYTATAASSGAGFTLTSSKGPCDFLAGTFSCAAGNTAGVFTNLDGSLAYLDSALFYAAAVPAGAVPQKVLTAANAVPVGFVWQGV
ncbi:related to ribonucleases [Rhynchosporium secalis]|uniref:Ribonuclease T2-like n=1 Tax=Rhynchosporium secalis TaxID=38038 RepID=A0A1E1M356_RHYSE|nr:related to ribonucleases [Rhynchosporium secalis]